MNKIELITKYSEDAFDEVYRAESRIGLLDKNTEGMRFVGAKTVKIPKWSSGGMYDYQRANGEVSGNFSQGTHVGQGYGYQQSDMGYEWETFTLAIDRAVQYRVDMFDDEETAKTLVARGSTQINKQVLVPEIDAYAFAKIATAASAELGNLVSSGAIGDGDSETSPIEALNQGLLWLEENEVPAEDQVIYCSPRFVQALRNTAKNGLVKPLLQGEFSKDVKFTIEEYEGRPLVSVPPRRFMTNIILGNGGYFGASNLASDFVRGEGSHPYIVKAGSSSAAIDFMIVARQAVYHIVKYNKIKVFGPDVVQDYDGYKVNVHIYHDVFIPDNKRIAVYVRTGGFAGASANTISLDATVTADLKLAGYVVLPGSTMTDGKIYKGTSPVVGSAAPAGATEVTIGGSALGEAGASVSLFVQNTKGVVLAVKTITLPSA